MKMKLFSKKDRGEEGRERVGAGQGLLNQNGLEATARIEDQSGSEGAVDLLGLNEIGNGYQSLPEKRTGASSSSVRSPVFSQLNAARMVTRVLNGVIKNASDAQQKSTGVGVKESMLSRGENFGSGLDLFGSDGPVVNTGDSDSSYQEIKLNSGSHDGESQTRLKSHSVDGVSARAVRSESLLSHMDVGSWDLKERLSEGPVGSHSQKSSFSKVASYLGRRSSSVQNPADGGSYQPPEPSNGFK